MTENLSPNINPIMGSNENKIQLLRVRRRELLIKQRLVKDADEIKHIENLLQEIDEVINRHDLSTTIRKRIKRDDGSRQ